MPQLSDLLEKKKFVKKTYRPWDLSGSGTVDNHNSPEQPLSSTENKTALANPAINEEQLKEIQQVTSHPTPITVNKKTGNISGNETGNKGVTYSKQTGNKQVTRIREPDNIQVTSREQPYNDLDNVTGNAYDINYLTEAIKKLCGIQKNIFLYIVNICTARATLDTGNILLLDLVDSAKCSPGSAKTSLNRLVEKYLIIRHQGKSSRGGHMVLGVTKEIQAAAIQAQQALFNPLKINYSDNVTGNDRDNNNAYSSSIYNNRNTITSLPEEWKKINFELLNSIGFSETQIKQLYEANITTPEIVQQSINHFAYGLEHSEKTKGYREPLNILMGVLRKGQKWHEAHYVSPQELALRQILDEKKKEKERRDTMIKDIVEIEFPEWKKKLSEEQVKAIVPEQTLRMNVQSAITASLKTHFLETILLPRLESMGLN